MKFWFNKKTQYLPQKLTSKQLELIDELDSYFAANCTHPAANDILDIRMNQIGIFSQALPVSVLKKQILQDLGELGSYILRSVSLITVNGDIILFIGFRRNKDATTAVLDDRLLLLYSDALTRTNDARANRRIEQ